MTTTNITLPGIIRALGRGKKGSRNLTFEEAYFTTQCILDGSISSAQLGAFLMLMRVKEETGEEIAAMTQAAHDSLPDYDSIDINWPAYAGKKKQPSWYILTAKLLAQNGIKILIHGAGEHTPGRQYASAVCEHFNIPKANSLAEAANLIKEQNIAYIALKNFLPVFSDIIDMKAELGLRSPVNTMVRHLNPLNATLTLQGMFHPAYLSIHHQAAKVLDQQPNVVLKGDAGEFEVRADSSSAISIHSDSQLETTELTPVLNSRSIRPEKATLEALEHLWFGKNENPYGESAVIETGSLLIQLLKNLPQDSARELAQQWWENRLA